MKYLLWTSLIFLIDVFVSQVASQELIVTVDPSEQALVRVGQNLTVLCKVGVPIYTCRVEVPGMVSSFLSPEQPAYDGVGYFGQSFETGQCGARITNVKESHDGIFKCSVLPKGNRFESSATTKIVVIHPPSSPELIITPGSHVQQIYKKGENVTISCRARSGRPTANVSLFLDEEQIGNDEKVFTTDPEVGGNSWAVKNVSHVMNSTDNGKTLRCVVDHITLDQPLATMQQLQVYFKPQPLPVIERYGYVIGQPGIVNVTIEANPKPEFIWYINEERLDEGINNKSNGVETFAAVELGRGLWGVALRINSMQKSDSEKKYRLEARNELGDFMYQIVLSPPTETAGGPIGRTCTFGRDCATMDKNSHCDTTKKQCACNSGFVASVESKRCLAGVRYNHSGCEISEQCLLTTPNSTCNSGRVCLCYANYRYASGACWANKGIGSECRTDNDCLHGMEERHAPVQCLGNKCACAKGYHDSKDKCQPVKGSDVKSKGIRLSSLSALATTCFLLLLPSVM